MKTPGEDEYAGHARASRRGALEGIVGGTILGLGISYWLQRTYPKYRQLPISLKTMGVVIIAAPALTIQAERRSLQYERSRWEGHGVRILDEKRLEEERRWEQMSTKEKLANWADNHQYSIILGGWVASLALAGGLIARDRMQTTPQKVVQARMWAQGLTIGLLIVAGALTQAKRAQAAKHGNNDHSWRDVLAQQERDQALADQMKQNATESTPARAISASH